MKTLPTKFVALIFATFLTTQSVFALPTMASENSQDFDENQNIAEANWIDITDDATTPEITAEGDIRIHIPKDFPIIWDDRVSEVRLDGSAVSNGRFSGDTVSVTYEDKSKTAVLDVQEDFAAGENVKVRGLVFEGFYWGAIQGHLELILAEGGDAVVTDSKELVVYTSAIDDNTAPEAPRSVQAVQTADHKIKLTWEDPSDMDVYQIQILRGVGSIPPSGTPYYSLGTGIEEYTDSNVSVGQTLTYLLRGNDGRNLGDLSAEVSITVLENLPEEEATVCTTDYTPVCGSDSQTYSNSCNAEAAGITSYTDGECVDESAQNVEETTPETPALTSEEEKANQAGITLTALQNAISKYSDLEATHWSSGFLARLNQDGILNGYPDGSIQPDTTINRAELAKIAVKSFGLTEDSSESSFTDVSASDWFDPFVNALQNVGAVWISSGEYLPAAGVARGEATWVLMRASGIDLGEAITKPFPDVSASHPYARAIAKAKELGIVNGYDNGDFGINDTLTRAQVAKIVVLIKQYLESEG